jgi:hypothetical protein
MLSTDCAESADCAGVLHLLLHLRVDTVERPTIDVHPLAIGRTCDSERLVRSTVDQPPEGRLVGAASGGIVKSCGSGFSLDHAAT